MDYNMITLDTIVSSIYSHAKNLCKTLSDSLTSTAEPTNQGHHPLPRIPTTALGCVEH